MQRQRKKVKFTARRRKGRKEGEREKILSSTFSAVFISYLMPAVFKRRGPCFRSGKTTGRANLNRSSLASTLRHIVLTRALNYDFPLYTALSFEYLSPSPLSPSSSSYIPLGNMRSQFICLHEMELLAANFPPASQPQPQPASGRTVLLYSRPY